MKTIVLQRTIVLLCALGLLTACGLADLALNAPTATPEASTTPMTGQLGSQPAPATTRTTIAEADVEVIQRPTASPQTRYDDRYEPDDRRELAQTIQIGEVQARTFSNEYDEDWVRVDVRDEYIYQFETFDLEDGADTILTLYDAEGNQVAYNDDYGGLASRIYYQAEHTTQLYLQITAYALAEPGLGYKLRVFELLPPAPDAYEPDDRQADASLITVGEVQARTFHLPSDEDWVAIDVIAGATYRFTTFDLDPGLDTILTLYDHQGNELDYNDDFIGLASQIIHRASNTERIYLHVTTYVPPAPGAVYRLEVALEP
ncbi:hypothetical protein [Candidatus Viridilinea mediisalina]|uniref:Peptidase C-terminal archaeal/bacterial domain-containing protein n=1 Tax=Candidatus Viridilinea mediisalina TaxID=2024553 RepID=A0A2A6RPM6_9CHLR|nr:hypothetical protein [Candidatus Viridilinea mediisalina]PDW04967.1 hypothetical protein CJ255_00895 [Candidatus Viridilinea mediisalina]